MRSFILAALVLVLTTAGASAGIVARIDISSQTMTVSDNGSVLYSWRVSTARRGYRTPRGQFHPVRMNRMWYSHKYHMSPMPYSIFFRGGYAIHGTYSINSLGHPVSHGCVRLHPNNARTLFNLVRARGAGNTQIIVVD